MTTLHFVPRTVFKKLESAQIKDAQKAQIFSDLCRINIISMIMKAGSGHLGSSLSSIDLMVWLYLNEMKTAASLEEWRNKEHDIFFSSKGHDAPAIYALMIACGQLPEEQLTALRQINGLPGHPDIQTPFIETNTGSLGMGISKAKGMICANRLLGKRRKVFVLMGDGELQEGQVWESLVSAANRKYSELTVIVDHNKIQSDIWVERVSHLGDLEAKFRSFGWHVSRINGHDFHAMADTFRELRNETDLPKVVLADTIKGNGISFMQSDRLKTDDRLYLYHSGAPSAEDYEKAIEELKARLSQTVFSTEISFKRTELDLKTPLSGGVSLIPAYQNILAELAAETPDLLALDADLAKDCGLLEFERKFPERFIECGIAEQDMLSQASGLALQGFLPVVHSFACFLGNRANEHFYNQATERTKVLYVATLAGLLPAGPGHSHQSVRDIGALGSVPGLVMIEPGCTEELRLAMTWAVKEQAASAYLRLVSIPCESHFSLPPGYRLERGKGIRVWGEGTVAIVAYGPVLLNQAILSAEIMKKEFNIDCSIINLPWLNELDPDWLALELQDKKILVTLDDHYVKGGQGEMIAAAVAEAGMDLTVRCFGVEDIPACGSNCDVLKHHKLDSASIARRVSQIVTERSEVLR